AYGGRNKQVAAGDQRDQEADDTEDTGADHELLLGKREARLVDANRQGRPLDLPVARLEFLQRFLDLVAAHLPGGARPPLSAASRGLRHGLHPLLGLALAGQPRIDEDPCDTAGRDGRQEEQGDLFYGHAAGPRSLTPRSPSRRRRWPWRDSSPRRNS